MKRFPDHLKKSRNRTITKIHGYATQIGIDVPRAGLHFVTDCRPLLNLIGEKKFVTKGRPNRLTEMERCKDKGKRFTMVQNNQKSRRKYYWVTRLSVCLFARTAHSFACSTLLDSLTRSTALMCLLASSLPVRESLDAGTWGYSDPLSAWRITLTKENLLGYFEPKRESQFILMKGEVMVTALEAELGA